MDNRRRTEEKVFSYMEKHNMAAPGQGIVMGVSGGADSVCLLFVLKEYAGKVPLKLAAVHVNHGLRPDAGEDAEFVERLCRKEGIPFFLREVDVKAFASQGKYSSEEAGRLLRYKAFREIAASLRTDRIAVAHNENDLAETVLFHLFRGSGLKGLCGISPVREEIIRPLLCLKRGEIEEYLRERGISWREDSTNHGDDYTRNRIRHYVIPYAQDQVSAKAVDHICRAAGILAEAEEYLEQQTQEALKHCVELQEAENVSPESMPDGGKIYCCRFAIDIERFRALHVTLRKRLLLELIRQLAPGRRDIASVHVEEVLALFHKEGNPVLNLPFGITAEKSYRTVLLYVGGQGSAEEQMPVSISVVLPPGETKQPLVFALGDLGHMEFSVFFIKNGQKVPGNQYTKWFDCDKIMESPVLRFRQAGDFLSISDGHDGMVRKMLKDYMITEKIPRSERCKIPLLAEGSHVLWLIGYRISEYYKIDGNTKRVLQVKLLGGCPDSGTEDEDGRTH